MVNDTIIGIKKETMLRKISMNKKKMNLKRNLGNDGESPLLSTTDILNKNVPRVRRPLPKINGSMNSKRVTEINIGNSRIRKIKEILRVLVAST